MPADTYQKFGATPKKWLGAAFALSPQVAMMGCQISSNLLTKQSSTTSTDLSWALPTQ